MVKSDLDPGQILQHAYDDATTRIKVDASVSATITGAQEVTIDESDDSIQVFGNDGAANRAIKTDANGELQIDVLSSALPAGAATSAKQDTSNSSLSSIDSKITAVNTGAVTISSALPAGSNNIGDVDVASMPVVSIDDNGGSLTVDGSVAVSNFPASQAVTGPLTDTQLRASAVPISASTLPLPSGAATLTAQGTGNTSLSSIDTKTPALGQALAAASVPVVLTAAQLSTLTPVSTVTANAGTNLNTSALALDSTLSSMSAKLPTTLGQKTMANSQAVVLASDQTSIPASQSGTWTVQPGNTANTTAWKVDGSSVTQPISAVSLPLPTGAALDATVSTLSAKHTAATSTITSVAASGSTVSLKASNANRKGLTLYNDSSVNCFVAFAASATTSAFTLKMAAASFYDMPFPIYTGDISGIWDSATGNMRVTELT